jgi:hypothetical protein
MRIMVLHPMEDNKKESVSYSNTNRSRGRGGKISFWGGHESSHGGHHQHEGQFHGGGQ